jgi:nucleoid DNA-binding protein
MTHRELEITLSHLTDFTRNDVHRVMQSMCGAFKVCLIQGDLLMLQEFGTFYVARIAAADCRNPRTQAPVTSASRLTARFRMSNKLRT